MLLKIMKNIIVEIDNTRLLMSVEFRPIIQFSGNKILRYEVMARFFNIEGFQASTQQSFYELEQRGLINGAIDFLFDTLCNLLTRKESLAIALNVSQLWLSNSDRLDILYKKCRQTGVHPGRIELSGQFIQNELHSSLPFLQQAKEYGFLTALDDAGHGAMPDDRWQLFNFDTIKFSHASLERIAMDTVKFYRLQKAIGNVIASGTSVICDGIKSSADLPSLNKYHHIGLQGYHFHRTLTLSQLQLLEDV